MVLVMLAALRRIGCGFAASLDAHHGQLVVFVAVASVAYDKKTEKRQANHGVDPASKKGTQLILNRHAVQNELRPLFRRCADHFFRCSSRKTIIRAMLLSSAGPCQPCPSSSIATN